MRIILVLSLELTTNSNPTQVIFETFMTLERIPTGWSQEEEIFDGHIGNVRATKCHQDDAVGRVLRERQIKPEDVSTVKRQILRNIKDRSVGPHQLFKLDEQFLSLFNTLKHTIKDNEGHSVLIIGPKKTGKTSLVNNALLELRKQFGNDFMLIRLDSKFQSDDNLAIREFARQLDHELALKQGFDRGMLDKALSSKSASTFEQTSITYTMSALLEILDQNSLSRGSQASNMPIVVTIENFEGFTSHSRQALLYNLFELSQNSNQTPITIIGISTKVTTRELLEKRVKSRFSQRIIQTTHSKTIEDWFELVKGVFQCVDHSPYSAFVNETISQEIDKPSSLRRLCIKEFLTTKDINVIKFAMIPVISAASSDSLGLDFTLLNVVKPLSFDNIIAQLCDLGLALLISAARVYLKLNIETMNFELAYKEYVALTKMSNNANMSPMLNLEKSSGIIVSTLSPCSRSTMKELWELLQRYGFLIEVPASADTNESAKMFFLEMTLEDLRRVLGNLESRRSSMYMEWCNL